MKEYLLDAQFMEHPKPLEEAITIIRKLNSKSYLYMIHRKEPIPLLALAKEHQLNYFSYCDSKAIWHILITPNIDIKLDDILNSKISLR